MDLKVFVKANLEFELEGHRLKFTHRPISTYGVSGLPWGPLSPETDFGRHVDCKIHVLTPEGLDLFVDAIILKDHSLYSQQMGLRFRLRPDQVEDLSAVIRKRGFFPTEYVRKYPRIPAAAVLPTFPLRVVATLAADPDAAPDAEAAPQLPFDVGNLSPNGILLSTESPLAQSLEPGHRLRLTLDPRGWFPAQVHVEGLVCRVLDEVNPESGNRTRHFGVKFTRVDTENRLAFIDLLKDILEQIRLNGEKRNPRSAG